MRRRLFAALIALCLIPVAALSEDGDWARGRAMEMAADMAALAEDESYIAMFSASDDVLNLAQAISAGNYGEPVEAYTVALPDKDAIRDLIAQMAGGELPEMSSAAWDEITWRIPTMIPSVLNGREGQIMLATSSVLNLTRGYAVPADAVSCIVALDFGGEYCVLAGFCVDDGVAVADSAFISRAGYEVFVDTCRSLGLI